jgi:hypothetical protein
LLSALAAVKRLVDGAILNLALGCADHANFSVVRSLSPRPYH